MAHCEVDPVMMTLRCHCCYRIIYSLLDSIRNICIDNTDTCIVTLNAAASTTDEPEWNKNILSSFNGMGREYCTYMIRLNVFSLNMLNRLYLQFVNL